jgi:hypothetical protein
MAFEQMHGTALCCQNKGIAAEACEVWIEELATQRRVTDKVSGKGTKP